MNGREVEANFIRPAVNAIRPFPDGQILRPGSNGRRSLSNLGQETGAGPGMFRMTPMRPRTPTSQSLSPPLSSSSRVSVGGSDTFRMTPRTSRIVASASLLSSRSSPARTLRLSRRQRIQRLPAVRDRVIGIGVPTVHYVAPRIYRIKTISPIRNLRRIRQFNLYKK